MADPDYKTRKQRTKELLASCLVVIVKEKKGDGTCGHEYHAAGEGKF